MGQASDGALAGPGPDDLAELEALPADGLDLVGATA